MSPRSPEHGGSEPRGPRRINWGRLPGPDADDDPGTPRPADRTPRPADRTPPRMPSAPRDRPEVPGGRGPRTGAIPTVGRRPGADDPRRGGPRTGGQPRIDPERPRRDGPRTGSQSRVEGPTGSRPRVEGATGSRPRVEGATGSRPPVDRPAAARPLAGSRPGGTGEAPTVEVAVDRPETRSRLSRPHKRQYLSLWVELPLLLLVAFSAAVLLRTFAVQPFYIPSGSMELTLQEGDKVLVLKLTATLRSPQRGEVVVFRGTDQWDPEWRPATGGGFLSDASTAVLDLIGLAEPDEKDFIKRVIGVGGDTVVCCDDDGRVMVNGISLDESSYIHNDAPLDYEPGTCHSRRFNPVVIPDGHIWVMGDHRGNSQDSRCQGTVPVENVIGRAVQLVWPTSRATRLEIPDSFAVLQGTGEAESVAAAGHDDTVIPTSYAMPPAVPPGTSASSAVARHGDGRSRARSANA